MPIPVPNLVFPPSRYRNGSCLFTHPKQLPTDPLTSKDLVHEVPLPGMGKTGKKGLLAYFSSKHSWEFTRVYTIKTGRHVERTGVVRNFHIVTFQDVRLIRRVLRIEVLNWSI